jgi:hypothetical protein
MFEDQIRLMYRKRVQKVGGDSGTNVIKGAAETCCMAWLVSALLSQPTTGLTGELLASIHGEVGDVFEIQVACGRPRTQSKLCTRRCTLATAIGKGNQKTSVVCASVFGVSAVRAQPLGPGASVIRMTDAERALVAGGP